MLTVLICYLLLTVGTVAMFAWLFVEQRRHAGNLAKIPVRIMVNGIRGKSSVTRLCAGALRTSPHAIVVAKTTGTAARFIAPDASESPINRRLGTVNVIEQVGVVHRAAELGASCLVVECMAVDPNLQELNQRKLIRSNVGVITNVREDHLEEMGPTLEDIARSLSRSMPVGGVCFTAEREYFAVLADEAWQRNCTLVPVDPAASPTTEMRGIRLGDLQGERRLGPGGRDPRRRPPRPRPAGNVRRATGSRCPARGTLRWFGTTELQAANLFAANDPTSTLMNIELLNLADRDAHVVINCRPDRMERNAQMGEIVAQIDPSLVYLIGTPTRSARRAIAASHRSLVVDLGGDTHTGQSLLEGIGRRLRPATTLLMIGNIHGQGEHLLAALGMGSA